MEAKHKREGNMHQLKIHDLFKLQTFSRSVCFAVNIKKDES